MKKLFGNEAVSPFPGTKSVVAIGMFDGVHLGHQRVISKTIELATANEAVAFVLTFDIHPRSLLSAGPEMICSLNHRLVLINQIGPDAAWVLSFTEEFSKISADDFCRKFLIERLNACGVVLGGNGSFGYKGEGNAGFLQKSQLPLWCEIVEPVVIEGVRVSSSNVRDAVCNGDLRQAELMLGRPVSVLGTVMHGKKLGRTIGFPTLNVDPHHELHPPRGVYATTTRCGDSFFKSITNIGHRPTVDSTNENDIYIETHLFDFHGNLYGQSVEVFFHEKIRDEKSFSSLDNLRQQILLDVENATFVLSKVFF